MSKKCTGLFAHSLEKMKTAQVTKDYIFKICEKCGFTEVLPHSHKVVYYADSSLAQKKKWAADDNRRELLQPMNKDGSVNDDFTKVYGYNPFDDRTKAFTPKVQGGSA
jgi:predicted nucleic-acid-binding Zn-ribbon protein